MPLNFRRWVLLASVFVLPVSLGGCNDPERAEFAEYSSAESTSNWTGGAAEAAPLPSPEETLNTALILGDRAQQLSQTAQTATDWELAAARWEQALNLLRAIPPQTAPYATAQATIQRYDPQLQSARQQIQSLR